MSEKPRANALQYLANSLGDFGRRASEAIREPFESARTFDNESYLGNLLGSIEGISFPKKASDIIGLELFKYATGYDPLQLEYFQNMMKGWPDTSLQWGPLLGYMSELMGRGSIAGYNDPNVGRADPTIVMLNSLFGSGGGGYGFPGGLRSGLLGGTQTW